MLLMEPDIISLHSWCSEPWARGHPFLVTILQMYLCKTLLILGLTTLLHWTFFWLLVVLISQLYGAYLAVLWLGTQPLFFFFFWTSCLFSSFPAATWSFYLLQLPIPKGASLQPLALFPAGWHQGILSGGRKRGKEKEVSTLVYPQGMVSTW